MYRPQRSKYGAKKVEIDGIKFASKAESDRYVVLRDCKSIEGLQLQPRFTLQEKFTCRGENIRAIEYVADFMYVMKGRVIVEDVKGMILPEFKMKLKLWKKRYGDEYEFRIIKGAKAIRTQPE